jgi:parvulin-like peptidyl-prolyl isomerase
MRIARIILFSALFFSILAGSGCMKKDPVVARVGDHETIRQSQLLNEFQKQQKDPDSKPPTLEGYRTVLNTLVDRKIRLAEAYRMGLDKDTSAVERFKAEKQRILLNALYQKEIVDRLITEKSIRDFYARSGKEVLVRTIFFKTTPQMTPAQVDSVQAVAEAMLKRIRKGELFSELARQYSQDETTAMNGGLIGALSYVRANDPIRNAVFSLKTGEISKPVKTALGINILKVEEIRPKDREPFEQAHDRIHDQLMRENRGTLAENTKAYWEKFKAKSRFEWNEKTLDSVSALLGGERMYMRNQAADTLGRLPAGLLNSVLLKHGSSLITVKDLEQHIRTKSYPSRGLAIGNKETMKQFVERWVMADILLAQAEQKRLESDPDVKQKLNESKERAMMAVLYSREIFGPFRPSMEEARRFFQTHPALYNDPEKVRIQEVQVADLALAKKIRALADRKHDLGRLPAQYTIRPGMKEKNGEFGPFSKNGWGRLGAAAFDLKVGQIAGPIELEDKSYSVIRLLGRIPEQPKDFQKMVKIVMRDMMVDTQRQKEAAWMETKRKDYPVQIDEAVLAGLIHEKK